MGAAPACRLGFQRLGFSGGSCRTQILRRVQHRAHILDADFSENLPRPASAEPLKSQILKSLKNRNSPTGTPRRDCSASSIWGDVLQVSPNPALSCTDMPLGGWGGMNQYSVGHSPLQSLKREWHCSWHPQIMSWLCPSWSLWQPGHGQQRPRDLGFGSTS